MMHWTRRLTWMAAAGLAMVGLLAAAPGPLRSATPSYVYYYRTFGAWTVICALDEASGHKECRLGAPPPGAGSGGPEIRIEVAEAPQGPYAAIAVRIGWPVDPARPAALAVDDRPPHETAITRTGEAVWQGSEARAVLDEMARGGALAVTFFQPGEAGAVGQTFPLDGFAAARQTYLQRVAAIGAAAR